MQYLLTAQELNELQDYKKLWLVNKDRLLTQEQATELANIIPIITEWQDQDEKPEPWGCILSAKEEHYCDECPVELQCPNVYKQYSK